MMKLVLEIPASLELGVSVGSGRAPGIDLSFGTSKSYAKGELGLQEGKDYTSGWVKAWAASFQGFHAVPLGRRLGRWQH